MKTALHTCPIYKGEDVMSPPEFTDSRVKPWVDRLVELGVVDENGILLGDATIRRGIGPSGYLFQITWNH